MGKYVGDLLQAIGTAANPVGCWAATRATAVGAYRRLERRYGPLL